MEKLSFIQIYKDNQKIYNDILHLWSDYFSELYEGENNSDRPTSDEIIHDLNRRINIQGRRIDMHFELLYCGDVPVGFANFAIDTSGIIGLIEKGYGFIMEFYIVPEFRRKRYGQSLYKHIEETLINDGSQNVYLTSDTVAGVPFWGALGFNDSGKIDPDSKLPIFIKQIKDPAK